MHVVTWLSHALAQGPMIGSNQNSRYADIDRSAVVSVDWAHPVYVVLRNHVMHL